jgi:hypothetical protein
MHLNLLVSIPLTTLGEKNKLYTSGLCPLSLPHNAVPIGIQDNKHSSGLFHHQGCKTRECEQGPLCNLIYIPQWFLFTALNVLKM